MSRLDLPELPASLKSIQHYLTIASAHDQRDPVITFWCRMYAATKGLKICARTHEGISILTKLMRWLEATKKASQDNKGIANEADAQAHVENWALKLFRYADKNDRACNFGKSVVQSFFTAGLLYDVLTLFGELGEQEAQNGKYAKWKAAYIHNCLKNGETPIPGPVQEDEDGEAGGGSVEADEDFCDTYEAASASEDRARDGSDTADRPPDGRSVRSFQGEENSSVDYTKGEVDLSLEQTNKAQKFIKWAGSALNYDDVPTAIVNLRKALHLLTTGQEMEETASSDPQSLDS